jgi:hypothetical protein
MARGTDIYAAEEEVADRLKKPSNPYDGGTVPMEDRR